LAIKQIADECGFSSVDILRRAFLRQLKGRHHRALQ